MGKFRDYLTKRVVEFLFENLPETQAWLEPAPRQEMRESIRARQLRLIRQNREHAQEEYGLRLDASKYLAVIPTLRGGGVVVVNEDWFDVSLRRNVVRVRLFDPALHRQLVAFEASNLRTARQGVSDLLAWHAALVEARNLATRELMIERFVRGELRGPCVAEDDWVGLDLDWPAWLVVRNNEVIYNQRDH